LIALNWMRLPTVCSHYNAIYLEDNSRIDVGYVILFICCSLKIFFLRICSHGMSPCNLFVVKYLKPKLV
jgi:hypothetical protein